MCCIGMKAKIATIGLQLSDCCLINLTMNLKKYPSKSQPGVFFWAEKNQIGGSVQSYCVIAQAMDCPKSEACDDWFANFKDADRMAQLLSSE